MTDRFLLGVDLGTTASKAALYDCAGNLASEGRADVPLEYPASGGVEQDLDVIYCSALSAIRQCLASTSINPARIAGLAFDSQMAGLGAIDESFRPAAKFDSWLDMRCQPYIEELDRHYGELVTLLTGCPPTCNHGPKMLWLMHERPEAFSRTAKFVMPTCYVAGKLAGLRAEAAFIDRTFLHFTAAAETQSGSWSQELCAGLGFSPRRLPRIVEPSAVIGEVRPEAAAITGLKPGTPIAAGCGDTAAGALGAGVVRPGMLLDTAGTASVLACSTDRFLADRKHRALMTMRSVIPGIWHPLAYIGGGGLALRWFTENFGPPSGDGSTDYHWLFNAASAAPAGCEGLMFSPHLGGRVCPSASGMRGAWEGFSWNHKPGHFARAILESIGFEYANYIRIVKEYLADFAPVEARVIGGGARERVWNQIKANIVNVPYRRVARAEGATWGSALVAGAATGLIGNLQQTAIDAAGLCEETIVPERVVQPVYSKMLGAYLAWQERLQNCAGTYGRLLEQRAPQGAGSVGDRS
jgi:xylulokinase